ncbi:hypothetical protein BGX31_003667 [Mortierella sp. GBA43]|nr:hypothetical protein BGX31_003667 [Mortierella sp. GBA43]
MRATAIATTAILWLSGIASIVNADVTCKGGNIIANFNPGVSFQSTTIQAYASGNLGVCQSADFPKITSGTLYTPATGPGKCTGPLFAGGGSFQINWNDQSSSTGSQMGLTVEIGQWWFNGAVSGGRFAGKTVRATGKATISFDTIGYQCVHGGLKQYPGTIDSFVIAA